MRKSFLFIVVLIICSLLVKTQNAQPISVKTEKFLKTLELISYFYVDTTNEDQLIETAIVEMLKDLDPHSMYISAKDLKKMNEPLQGSFEGIGIQFNILEDTLLVVTPISGGPSEKVGIISGDRIIEVDGENIAGVGLSNKGVQERLRGEKGTEVSVSILRRGEKKLIDFTITRDKIPIFSLDAAYMVNDSIGYIKLNRFSSKTVKEFRDALYNLQDKGVKHLILDLQGNGGGYLNSAVKLADEFLESKRMIVYTKGLNSPRREYKSTSIGNFEEGKVIILVDEGSASDRKSTRLNSSHYS